MGAKPARALRTPKKRARAKDWGPAFLKAFADTHLVSEAAKAARVGRRTVYDRRDSDAKFAQAWAEIVEDSTEQLERVAVKRAQDGSDVLLIFLLKARRPDIYREHHKLEHTGPAGGPLNVRVDLDDKQRKALGDVLRGRPASRTDD